jgi:hypothetical protein
MRRVVSSTGCPQSPLPVLKIYCVIMKREMCGLLRIVSELKTVVCFISPEHGDLRGKWVPVMASSVDGGTASNMEGSSEYIE